MNFSRKFLFVFLLKLSGVVVLISSKTACDSISCSDENIGTLHPIIGIVSQEITPNFKRLFSNYSSYIAASYVKAVESSGARVVPVLINKNESYYRDMLYSINGILLPGGSSMHGQGNPYYDTVYQLYKISKEINANGSKSMFPIFGVCQGFEFLLTVANNNASILKRCNVSLEMLPLEFSLNYSDSKYFSGLNDKQFQILRTENVTMNNHIWCVFENDFRESNLYNNWLITSTSTSINGQRFISSIESIEYPFYAVQFHPEKVAFEWNKKFNFFHSENAIIANRYFYDFFLKICRTNGHKFKTEIMEYESLIYNYVPVRSSHFSSFEQMYLFN